MIQDILAVNNLTSALIIFALFLAGAVVTYFLAGKLFMKLLRYTNVKINPQKLTTLKRPVSLLVILIGVYYSLRQIPSIQAYQNILTDSSYIAGVLIIAYILTRITTLIINHHIQVNKEHQTTPRLVTLVVSIVIFTIGIVMILQYYNVEITAIVTTLGIGGLAIGLALQDTLANLFAGLHLITAQPIKVGDYIELQSGTEGYVVDITWRSTRIRQIPNNIVIVPNRLLADSIITNDSMPEEELACVVNCGVSYESDLERVEAVTLEVAQQIQSEQEGAVKGFEPFIRYYEFADSNINFRTYLRVHRYFDRIAVTHEFIKQLHKRFEQEDIEISWPVRKVYTQPMN